MRIVRPLVEVKALDSLGGGSQIPNPPLLEQSEGGVPPSEGGPSRTQPGEPESATLYVFPWIPQSL